ncbi:MAG: hypothetical protein WCQ57_10015 [Verrucomicrobiota bacterium]
MSTHRSFASAGKHLTGAMRLRCPACGTRPIFIPWYKVRSLHDWFTPLDGCPRCGYAYEREPGYFLLSIWAINYGFSSILGLWKRVSPTYCHILEWRPIALMPQLIMDDSSHGDEDSL